MGRVSHIESIAGIPYVNMKELASRHDLCMNTVRQRVREIESQIGKRYPEQVVINDGNIVLINDLAFLDWLSVRRRAADKNAAKSLKPFDPAVWMRLSGWSNRPVIFEEPVLEEKEDQKTAGIDKKLKDLLDYGNLNAVYNVDWPQKEIEIEMMKTPSVIYEYLKRIGAIE